MKVTAALNEKYVPKFSENRKLPESEQITVEILWPTVEQSETLKDLRTSVRNDSRDEIEIKVRFDTKRILREHVGKIANLDSMEGGKLVKIKSGEMLAESRNPKLRPLVDELKAVVTGGESLDDDAEKN